MEDFPLRVRKLQRCPPLPPLFNITVQVLISRVEQKDMDRGRWAERKGGRRNFIIHSYYDCAYRKSRRIH